MPETPPPLPKLVETQLPNEHISDAPQALHWMPPRPHAESAESRTHCPSEPQQVSHVEDEHIGAVVPQAESHAPPRMRLRPREREMFLMTGVSHSARGTATPQRGLC